MRARNYKKISGKTRDHESERAGVRQCINRTRNLIQENQLTIKQDVLPESENSSTQHISEEMQEDALPEIKDNCTQQVNEELSEDVLPEIKDNCIQQLNDVMSEDVITNIGCLSNSLEVVHTLGYGGGTVPKELVKGEKDIYGNVIKEREVTYVSSLVGYIIKNIGTTNINYTTEVFTYNEDTGKYEGERVNKILEPGGEAQISKLYFNMLLLMPEFNCEISNGKLICNGYYSPEMNNPYDELMASLGKFYFRFKGTKKVHDSVCGTKLPIAVPISYENKSTKDWCVTKEYIETFGNLNNKKRVTYRIKTKGFDKAEDMASYMRKASGGVF